MRPYSKPVNQGDEPFRNRERAHGLPAESLARLEFQIVQGDE